MGSLTRENIQQFCRACLRHLMKKPQQPAMQNEPSFYHINQTKDLNKWMAILNPLEIVEHSNKNHSQQQYPKYVCRSCYENFKHVNDFKEMVLHSYSVMTKLLTVVEKKEESQPKDDITVEELQIKSEPVDNDEYMDNVWEIGENTIRNDHYVNLINQREGSGDGNYKGLKSPNIPNQLLDKDQMKLEPTQFAEPSEPNLEMTLSPSIEGEEGQPKAIKSYKCPMCKISYVHKYTYVAHIRQMHLGIERAFECEICHKKYTKFCNLYRHLRLDHNQSLRQYKCEYKNCNRSFRQLSTRRKHYENLHNHEPLPDQMEKLSNEFLRQEELKNAHHSKNNNSASSSNVTTNAEKELQIKSTLSSNKRIFICPLCSTAFETSYNLKVHMNETHIDDLKFPCHICGKHKISQMKLDEHIATVHNNPRVKCDICQKVLKSKSHLRQHILSVHNGIKPYACEYCPSTFAAKNTLKVHTRIHTGEKPFKCPVCDRRFRQLTPMKKHVEIHERERRNAVTEITIY